MRRGNIEATPDGWDHRGAPAAATPVGDRRGGFGSSTDQQREKRRCPRPVRARSASVPLNSIVRPAPGPRSAFFLSDRQGARPRTEGGGEGPRRPLPLLGPPVRCGALFRVNACEVRAGIYPPPLAQVRTAGLKRPHGSGNCGKSGNARSVHKTPRGQSFHLRHHSGHYSHEQWEILFASSRGPLGPREQGPWTKFQRGIRIIFAKIADFSTKYSDVQSGPTPPTCASNPPSQNPSKNIKIIQLLQPDQCNAPFTQNSLFAV
eukprot:gene24532-biopygen19432